MIDKNDGSPIMSHMPGIIIALRKKRLQNASEEDGHGGMSDHENMSVEGKINDLEERVSHLESMMKSDYDSEKDTASSNSKEE